MGFRTVVMLNNDMAHEWSKDPNLGAKISEAMNYTTGPRSHLNPLDRYGRAVECTHADTQTLVHIDGYEGFTPLAYSFKTHGPTTDKDILDLVKHAADKMGYRLVKKSVKKV